MSYFFVYPEYMFLLQEEVPIGSAKVRAVFSSGSGKVAGCMITTGKVVQDCNVRVLRKGKEVYVGSLDSLRRVKEAVKEVWNLHSSLQIFVLQFTSWLISKSKMHISSCLEQTKITF